MKIYFSLKTKITISFFFLFLLLALVSIPLHTMQENKLDESVAHNYQRVIDSIREERFFPEELEEYLKNLNFIMLENPHDIFSKEKILIRREGFELLRINEDYYLHIITPHFRLLVKDNSNKFEQSYIDILMVFLLGVLFSFIYYLILKNINDTQHQLKSRQLFLRTLMHELKTPIAKGRIVSELIDDEKQKNRIIIIFEKLNILIDNFAKVEQIVSKNYNLAIHSYTLKTLLERSIEMLMLENRDNIKVQNIPNIQLKVDRELFAMALKNLIDNALRYSVDSKVTLKEQDGALLFISQGKRLSKPLAEYFEAFHNDIKGKNHGMGLGLYIVNAILKMHSMELIYEHKDSENIFKILL